MIAGLGMRRGCAATEIVALVNRASAAIGQPVTALAAPAFKRGEGGLAGAALLLGLELLMVNDQDLHAAQPRCVTHSAAVERAVGHSSIAEACALAAAGPQSRLLLPRIKDRHSTCAVAESL